MIDKMTISPPSIDNSFCDLLYKNISDALNKEHKQLDEQFKHELSKIKFRGEITKEKIKRHGFKLIHQQGIGTYITKNNKRVTDIFFKSNI